LIVKDREPRYRQRTSMETGVLNIEKRVRGPRGVFIDSVF